MDDFDVIIVGAGPAGSSAAYKLAEQGQQVLLLERGKSPGSKNVYGGRIYPYSLSKLIPDYKIDAPIERYVKKENIVFMTESSSTSITYSSYLDSDKNSFTAIRSKFDEWLANKAVDKGATLFPEIRVDDLIIENNKVVGIKAGSDEIRAKMTIVADGATSLLSKKAGLRKDSIPDHYSIGVKEVIELSEEQIDNYFSLNPGDGSAVVYVGYPTQYMRGGAFLYTNKDTISLGIVVKSQDLIERKVQVGDLMNNFKKHKEIEKLFDTGKTVEYNAHLIPEAGFSMIPELYRDGLVLAGDSAGFVINNGYTFRGVDLAISSGIAAAQTFLHANTKSDFSTKSLSAYTSYLDEYNVLIDLKKYKKGPGYMNNPRLYDDYPHLVCDLLDRIYDINGEQRKLVREYAQELIRGRISLSGLIKDTIGSANSL